MQFEAHTQPLIDKVGRKLTRRFLGNLFPENCYEKNELKAYVQGRPTFHYKRDEVGNPMRYKVRQEYFYV